LKTRLSLALLLVILGSLVPAHAQPAIASELTGGRAVPDIEVQLRDDSLRTLSQLWSDQPLLVVFFYRRCSGVCVPLLEWVRNAAQEVGGLGDQYRVLALSFDASDTARDLRAQAGLLGLENQPGWLFARAGPDAVAEFANAVGFWFRYDEIMRQYDHSTMVVGIKQGRLVRTLLTNPGQPAPIRNLLWELRGRFVPTYSMDGTESLRCVDYDPVSGEVRLRWGALLLIVPALASLAITLTLFLRKRPHRRELTAPSHAT
jgi:cytochrome oxidase Cu insertion factor (SCO1/SenC/PrrC family)